MIHFLTFEKNLGLLQAFLATGGRAIADRVALLPYQQVASRPVSDWAPGAYVFTGVGRGLGSREPLSPARRWAIGLHAHLCGLCGPRRVLNDPARSLRRFELLHALADSGTNRFRAHRLDALPADVRWPVFLRDDHGSVWDAPPLLRDRAAFDAAARGLDTHERMAIEFADTADADGVYRKYGAFVVGERIVPRHLFFSHDWLVKAADLVDTERVDEELAYLRSNPHEQALLRACRVASIGYGRIDYAMLDGVPQIWEINTTPQIVNPPHKDSPLRRPVHEAFAEAFVRALDALDAIPG